MSISSTLTRRAVLQRGLALGAACTAGRYIWPDASPASSALLRTGNVDPARFTSLATLIASHHALDDIGLRATGSPRHARYADDLANRLERAGVTQVQKESVPLKYWEPSKWSLEVVGGAGAGPLPVAWYVPYSGSTPPGGVTAPLSLAPAPGEIGLVPIPITKVPLAAFDELDWGTPTHKPGYNPATTYDRAWLSQAIVESSLHLQGSGVAGLICVLDLPAPAAQGMYMPYHGVLYDMPAVFVDRDTGAKLQQIALGGGSVRLTLEATSKDITTPNVFGFIPGATEELVIIQSHHDGTNGLEENGCESVIAIADYLTGLGRCVLPRSVLVLLSTGHMAGNALGTETFLYKHADDYVARTAAAMTIEHLGALEWLPDASGTFVKTGNYELGAAFASPHQAVIDQIRAALTQANVTEDRVLRGFGTDTRSPDQTSWAGDGEGFWTISGLPSGNFITGPTYLLNADMKVFDLLDIAAIRRQAIAFCDLVLNLSKVPVAQLQVRRKDDLVTRPSAMTPDHPAEPAVCVETVAKTPSGHTLKLRYLGPRTRRHGVLIDLSVATGQLDDVSIELRRGTRVVARDTVRRVTHTRQQLLLRWLRGTPRDGRYTLVVRVGGHTVISRTVRIG